MKQYLVLTLALGVLAFTACMNTQDNADPQPGQIQLTAMKGLTKVTASSHTSGSSTTYTFDLDTANASISQYFIIQNTGDCDVKHLKLSTNNRHFYFTPSEIDVVPSSKTSTLQQLVKLSVIHGTVLNGVGPDSLLPMGNNVATAQLTGSTTNAHGDPIGISQSAQFKVYAKVFDLVAFSHDTVPFTFTNFGTSFYQSLLINYTSEGIRTYYPEIDTVTVLNTGNVPFHVRVFSTAGAGAVVNSFEVASGTSFRLPYSFIEIDRHGVVSDPAKGHLIPAQNGKVYMGL